MLAPIPVVPMPSLRAWRNARWLAAVLVVFYGLGVQPGPAHARDTTGVTTQIARAQLPKEGMQTLAAIEKSGPFAYPKDGVTFGNRERALPTKARGFYREYTVKTPGERTRGARRIVCGGNQEKAAAHSSEPCYYSDDHYRSFARITP